MHKLHHYIKHLFLLLALFCFSCSGEVDKSKLLGFDPRLFNGTEAEKLAMAVFRGDTSAIREEVLKNNVPVNIKEERFGTTPLMIATQLNLLKSAKCLLELGADPNVHEDTIRNHGENSVTLASSESFVSPEMLSLLLSYGGDPNSQCKGVTRYGIDKLGPWRASALEYASEYSIEKVRILLEAGADINKVDDETNYGAIVTAIMHNRMDILLYLLQHDADYSMKYPNTFFISDKTVYNQRDILDLLRLITLPINSRGHRHKMEVVQFLKSRGMDYSKAPIPDWIVKKVKKQYPNSWREYLEQY